jgi:hypothetical protein
VHCLAAAAREQRAAIAALPHHRQLLLAAYRQFHAEVLRRPMSPDIMDFLLTHDAGFFFFHVWVAGLTPLPKCGKIGTPADAFSNASTFLKLPYYDRMVAFLSTDDDA